MKSKVFGCRIPLAPDKIMTLSYSSEKFFEALRYIEECVEKGILVVLPSVNYTHYSVYEFIGINEITIKTDGSDTEIVKVDDRCCKSYYTFGTIIRYRGVEIKIEEG